MRKMAEERKNKKASAKETEAMEKVKLADIVRKKKESEKMLAEELKKQEERQQAKKGEEARDRHFQSRVMTSNHGTPPPAHMTNRLPNQPRAMAFNHGAINFHNYFQPIAGNHETPQAFEPFYYRNPSMHSSESSAIVGNSETSIQR
ncbi:hypothetical protein SO802_019729 [Lithocarpus litseifolius]|uniref:Uncharacterized protein n=1 Tax=Lithocarpus litseifolius TaxID=425828 RepID=A0AAW2CPH1_9ROSI